MNTAKTPKAKTATAKTKKAVKAPGLKFKTVDEYIDALPPSTKKIMKELRKVIKQAAPKAEEKISYSIPSFQFHGALVFFAAWKEHVSVYPKSTLAEKAIPELANYEGGKGTVQFPLDKPIPYTLVKKFVKFRVEENLRRVKPAKRGFAAK